MNTYKNREGITFTIGTNAYPLPSEPPPKNPFAVLSLGFRLIERDGRSFLNLYVLLRNDTERDLENPEVHFTLVDSEGNSFRRYVAVAGEVVESVKDQIPKKYVFKASDTHRVGLVVRTETKAHRLYQKTRVVRIKFHFPRRTRSWRLVKNH